MPTEPTVVPLTHGTTAYLQLPGGWFLNNAGWISGNERTLLIDTCATEARTRRLLDALQPFSTLSVAFTHAHGDHANGAELAARTGAELLATAPASEDIASGPHTYPEVFDCADWGDLDNPPALSAVTGLTRMDLGEHTIEIIPVPYHAHTNGDLVVWCPTDRVLFTGDLLFHSVTPLALQGSITGWLSALDWLDTFPSEHIVPGHGSLIGQDHDPITEIRTYFHWLLDASSAPQPDFDRLEAHARIRWAHWLDAERHAINLRVAHAEQHAGTCELSTLLDAMLHSAGGSLPLNLQLCG